MKITKRVTELKVGMYVILPGGWFDHPFARNAFLIKSRDQIQRIKGAGIKEVTVDSAKSRLKKPLAAVAPAREEVEPPDDWDPEKGLPQQLRNVIADQSLEPREKAQAVYEHSRKLFLAMLEHPTSETLGLTKEAVGDMLDTILADDETTKGLVQITAHDFYTYTHSVNVGFKAIALAKRIYSDDSSHDLRELGAGFFLHDLGKVRIPPEILNKPGRLDDMEMQVMRSHAYQSYKILLDADLMTEECRIVALQHHEREDGSGYPRGLAGEEIHDYGRICCIADVFDALTSERPYKKSMPPFEALRIMKEEMLGHFHPDIFNSFVVMFHESGQKA